jgi:hypothetical protein
MLKPVKFNCIYIICGTNSTSDRDGPDPGQQAGAASHGVHTPAALGGHRRPPALNSLQPNNSRLNNFDAAF